LSYFVHQLLPVMYSVFTII